METKKLEIVEPKGELITKENVITKEYSEFIYNLLLTQKKIDEAVDKFRDALFKEMKEKGITKIKANGINASIGADSTKESFDKDKFRDENPDLYDKYVEIKKQAGKKTLTISEKNDD